MTNPNDRVSRPLDRRQFTALGAVAAAALLLPARARAADPLTLRVGYIPILASAPLFVVAGEGWTKPDGISLSLTRFEAGTAAIQALAAGQVDVLYAGVAPVLVARSKGVDVSVVANVAVEELALVGRGALATLATTLPAAEAVRQLATKTGRRVKIGAQPAGSVPDTVLKHWLQVVAKLDPSLVEIVPMGIEKTQQALMAGALDAAMIREPTITIIRRTDPQSAVLALGGVMFPGQPGTVLAATGALIRSRPDAVGALVRAHLKATALIAAEPARAAKLVNEHLGKGLMEPEVLEAALASPATRYLADPRAIIEPAERMQAFQAQIGSAEGRIDVASGFDLRFYDAAVSK